MDTYRELSRKYCTLSIYLHNIFFSFNRNYLKPYMYVINKNVISKRLFSKANVRSGDATKSTFPKFIIYGIDLIIMILQDRLFLPRKKVAPLITSKVCFLQWQNRRQINIINWIPNCNGHFMFLHFKSIVIRNKKVKFSKYIYEKGK